MADAPASDPASAPDPAGAYQSLYRRYRPQRFADVLGQEHVTRALRNAVRDDRVAHAYLFSGPRGTGKTSTARILAMALNCAAPVEGEPDGTCASCRAVRTGSSLDVHELDAASNRRLEEMRELLSRVSLGTAGRWKVYIVDEVHQLTADAASALLKTLEEPPPNVVFVLATTDPQKVLPTIRSRTQHFEFRLLDTDVLGRLLRSVNERAELGLPSEAIDLVVRRGHGSARDALSVLDQVAAAGEVEDEVGPVAAVVAAIADRDPATVLTTVADAARSGRDPRRLAVDLLEYLRTGFLASQARSLVTLPDDRADEVRAEANRMGLPGLVRALDVVGQALVDMRDAVEPRITLEAALVRLATPADGLAGRVERLEEQVRTLLSASGPPGVAPAGAPRSTDPAGSSATGAAGATAGPRPAQPVRATPPAEPDQPGRPAGADRPTEQPPAGPRPAVTPQPAAGPRPVAEPPPLPGRRPAPPAAGADTPAPGRAAARPALGAHRRAVPGAAPAPPPPPTRSGPPDDGGVPPAGPVTEVAGDLPSRDELTKAWGDHILPGLKGILRAYVAAGRFVASEDGAAVLALPDRGLLARAEPLRPELEAAVAAHFGRSVPLRLALDGGAAPVPADEPGAGGTPGGGGGAGADEDLGRDELADLRDAGPGLVSPEQRLLEAFPGAEEISP